MKRAPVAPVNASPSQPSGSTEVRHLLEREQVRLAVEQVRRIPVPHFFVDLCAAWTGWGAGLGVAAWIWLAAMTFAQVGRTVFVVHLDRQQTLDPSKMLRVLTSTLAMLGAVQAVLMVMIFTRPIAGYHYIFTMIMVGNAAGAVSPAAGHLRSYLCWAAVFGGTLAVCWAHEATLQCVGIALLVLLLFYVLILYVRDQGRALGTLVSLSQSLRMERDRSERASHAKTRFFAAASHDLRQPLTALSYNAATVEALAINTGDETLALVGQGIRRALAESRSLLDSLLEVSELDAGAVEVRLCTVDVSALLRDVCDSFTPAARERGLVLLLEASHAGRATARTDAALLRRILQNLIGNAIKFTTAGEVTVQACEIATDAGPVIRVAVRDTGPGIPRDAQDKVFEEFFQVGNAERNRSQGLGLGLAVVRRIATLLDTTVVLSSEPGMGAAFSLDLPAERDAALIPPPRIMAKVSSGHVGSRLLLVDDEPAIRESLNRFLTAMHWDVRTAADLRGALGVVEEGFVPEVVIVDFRLGDGASGLDVLTALREMKVGALAWLVTGDTEPARIAAARAAGVPVLYKPIDGMELLSVLNQALHARSSTLVSAPLAVGSK